MSISVIFSHGAQGTTYRKDIPAKLAAMAKITEDSASKVAQARVPTGTIKKVELERKHGKLQYQYEFRVPGQSNDMEVNINAMDGSIISVKRD